MKEHETLPSKELTVLNEKVESLERTFENLKQTVAIDKKTSGEALLDKINKINEELQNSVMRR